MCFGFLVDAVSYYSINENNYFFKKKFYWMIERTVSVTFVLRTAG